MNEEKKKKTTLKDIETTSGESSIKTEKKNPKNKNLSVKIDTHHLIAQSVGAVEYTNCTSAEG